MDPRFSKAIGAMIGGMTGYILAIYALDWAAKDAYEVISEANEVTNNNEEVLKNIVEAEIDTNMGKRNRKRPSRVSSIVDELDNTKYYKKDFNKAYDKYFNKDNLEDLVKKYNGDEALEVEEKLDEATDPDADPDAPKIIDIEEAFRLINSANYSHVVLNYYQEDDILTTNDDKPLTSNYESFLGPDALVSFVPGTVNTVYVVNPKTTVVYELHHFDGSYNVLVLGLEEEEFTTRNEREVNEE